MLPMQTLAYLDGGTGSLLLQSAIAGALTAGYFVKTRWYAVKAFFARKNDSAGTAPSGTTPSGTTAAK